MDHILWPCTRFNLILEFFSAKTKLANGTATVTAAAEGADPSGAGNADRDRQGRQGTGLEHCRRVGYGKIEKNIKFIFYESKMIL